jgi:lambda family phage portal protein
MKRGLDIWTRALTRTVGLVAPAFAMRWAANRQRMLSYVGARRGGHNRAWLPRRKSADAILRKDASLLVARARDLVRNNTYVDGALDKICDNVVHTGIRPQFTHATTKEPLNHLEAEWRTWSDRIGLTEIQALALRHWWIDGEILAHDWLDADWLTDGVCPLRLTLHESDILNETIDGWLSDAEYAKRGIVFNIKGDPVRYSCYTAHPGDYLPGQLDTVDYAADHIIHFFLRKRASQTRGVSRLAPLIEEIRDLSEYQSSERIAARLAAAFGIFVKTNEYGAMADNPMGGAIGNGDGVGEQPELSDFIEPGRIQMLPVGTEIQVAKSDRPGSTYEPYVKSSLKGQSVGFHLRYGNYSHDYTESSYSSERSASLDERRGWTGQQYFLNQRFNTPLAAKWLRTMYAVGMLSGLRPEDVRVVWQNPGWPWIDPTKDAKAASSELDMGVTTRRKICAAKGEDYDEIKDQLLREERELKELREIRNDNQDAPTT